MSGVELCPNRGDCYKTCLFFSGFGSTPSVRKARLARARLWKRDPERVIDRLYGEIPALNRKARQIGLKLAVRLNVFSDIAWEGRAYLMRDNPDVQFYDYTKSFERFQRSLTDPAWPTNYDLTFSCNEDRGLDSKALQEMLRHGGRCTIVTREQGSDVFDWPAKMEPRKIVDGDEHDLTFLHPKGSIIVLAAKGKGGSRNPKKSRFIP